MEQTTNSYFLKQLKTGCLSHYAYYIESDGQAAIVDPLRDTQQYTELLSQRKAKLNYVINTHIHADFVSGYCALARQTKAEVLIGPKDGVTFKHRAVKDDEVITLGKVNLRILHTPGHTLESISILLEDPKGPQKQVAVMTGDALFLGDVGRPDLAVKGKDITKRHLTDKLFDSLIKLKKLDDDCVVLPAHGAGSACGKNLSSLDFNTIGAEKKSNYALLIDNKDEFYEKLVEGLDDPPEYFANDVSMNLQNDTIPDADELVKHNSKPISLAKFEEFVKDPNYIAVDTRDGSEFSQGYVPNSVNIPLKGPYAVWAASLLKPNTKIILICAEEKISESISRLTRTGLDCVEGYLYGGFEAWKASKRPVEVLDTIKAEDIVDYLKKNSSSYILDVRNLGELLGGIVDGSKCVNLNLLNTHDSEHLDKSWELVTMCMAGARSIIAYSVLKRKGYRVKNLLGGFSKAKEFVKVVKP